MGETNVAEQDTSQAAEKASVAEKGSTSAGQTPKTYTEEEHQKDLSDALTKQGREHKVIVDALTSERDSLKTQSSDKQTTLESIQSERDTLKTQLDSLTKDDPEKLNLVKRDNDLRVSEKKIKDDLKALNEEKTTNADKLALADDITRELNVIEIGTDYENPDLARLSQLCNQLHLNTKEEIRKVAGTLWTKKPSEENAEAEKKAASQMKPISGTTQGGKRDLNSLTPDEKLSEGFKALKKK